MISLEYIAGFFDGEGCIIIASRRPRMGRQRNYYLKLCISQKRPFILEEIKVKYPNSFVRPYSQNKECYMLIMQNEHAANFLRDIIPYLVVKKEECEIALDFYSRLTSSGKKLTEEELTIREQLKVKLQRLKRGKK